MDGFFRDNAAPDFSARRDHPVALATAVGVPAIVITTGYYKRRFASKIKTVSTGAPTA